MVVLRVFLSFFLILKKPSSRSLLAGEQSDALRILLRNDRKSRHRRIKKQRRYDGFLQEEKKNFFENKFFFSFLLFGSGIVGKKEKREISFSFFEVCPKNKKRLFFIQIALSPEGPTIS